MAPSQPYTIYRYIESTDAPNATDDDKPESSIGVIREVFYWLLRSE